MKKIMFNDKFGLTKAVLDGRKTMTRRIVKPQPTFSTNGGICWKGGTYGLSLDYPYDLKGTYRNFITGTEYNKSCKRYRIGEVVAIAQSYKTITDEFRAHQCIQLAKRSGWNNKMFTRADLMPHHIRITNVKVEHLQDISDDDCLKEGVYKGRCGSADTHFMDAYYYKGDIQPYCTPREAFAALIDKVSGKGTWESNPYVFVYEFELD